MSQTLKIRPGSASTAPSIEVLIARQLAIIRGRATASHAALEPTPAEEPRARQARDPLIRRGDGIMYAWGEAKRNGEIEALQLANASSISGEATIRAPGTHSDPVLAQLLAAEQLKLACAYTVNKEVEAWKRDRDTRLWADVADHFYASPYKQKNGDVAEELKISTRTVESVRSQIRRVIVLVIGVRVSRHVDGVAEFG